MKSNVRARAAVCDRSACTTLAAASLLLVAMALAQSAKAQSRSFGIPYAPPPAEAFAPAPAERTSPPPYGAGLAGQRWDGTERRPDTLPYPAIYPSTKDAAVAGQPGGGLLGGPGPAIWSGLYGGVHGGYHWDTLGAGAPFDTTASAKGGVLGAHLGYNWQFGRIVAGLELDADARTGRGRVASGASTFSEANRWATSTRLRAGYAQDNWLVYATAGLATGGFRSSLSTTGAAPGTGAHASDTLMGLVWGGGAALKLTPHISTSLEVLRTNYRQSSIAFSPAGAVALNPDATTVRAGVTFHLN